MNKEGIIYRVISPSGKFYIGQTIFSLAKRKQLHENRAFNKNSPSYFTKFAKAIRKYRDKLEWEIVHRNVNEVNLSDLERQEIINHNSYCLGYNSTHGGESTKGIKLSEATKRKISNAMKGEKNPFYGKKHSLEFKERLSQERQGSNNPFYGRTGEKHHLAKLTWDQVFAIRKKYIEKNNNKVTLKLLANEYSVSEGAIKGVVYNYTWKE